MHCPTVLACHGHLLSWVPPGRPGFPTALPFRRGQGWSAPAGTAVGAATAIWRLTPHQPISSPPARRDYDGLPVRAEAVSTFSAWRPSKSATSERQLSISAAPPGPSTPEPTNLQLRLCGYSANQSLAAVWEVSMTGQACPPPRRIMEETGFGIWGDGQYEALNRLILGLGFDIGHALVRHGVAPDSAGRLQEQLVRDLYATLSMPAMPIQDAIDLARFLVETTIGFVRFAVFLPKSVGGEVAIAAITKHEGFRWVQRRGFYPADIRQDG
jgi:hypothetical protein